MESEPIWYKYATFDEDGFVNGVSDDAPEEVKDAYKAYIDELNAYKERGEFIPR